MSTADIRLGIGGIHIESGTFSPLFSEARDFHASRGAEVMERYPFLAGRADLTKGVEWAPAAHFRAMPGGVVRREAYEAMKREILERLEAAGRLDGFYFDVHGAMSVEGLDDAELDLLEGVRGVVGEEIPVSCSGDLHGNVSAELAGRLDAITAYRTAPHLDFLETREKAMGMLVRMARTGERPCRAWVGIPVLLSGEMTSTEVEPGRSLWAELDAFLEGGKRRVGCLALGGVSVGGPAEGDGFRGGHGHRPGGGEGGGGGGGEAVLGGAGGVRIPFPGEDTEEAFAELPGLERPVFFSDAGDNPTAGGAGDTTGVLEVLLGRAEAEDFRAIFASLPDAAAMAACLSAGTGGKVSLEAGGKLDAVHSRPLKLAGRVRSLSGRDGAGGEEAVVDCAGGRVSVILSSRRRPYHRREDFLGLGVDPLEAGLTVVKIGYLEPELKAMAASHRLLLSAGGVNPLIEAAGHQRVGRPVFPLDEDFEWEAEAVIF